MKVWEGRGRETNSRREGGKSNGEEEGKDMGMYECYKLTFIL